MQDVANPEPPVEESSAAASEVLAVDTLVFPLEETPPQNQNHAPPEVPETLEPSPATADHTASTGVAGLDAQLGGGIPRGLTVLAVSHDSHAPQLLLDRFARAGLKAGERVYYYSLATPRDELQSRLQQSDWEEAWNEQLVLVDAYGINLRALDAGSLEDLQLTPQVSNVNQDLLGRMLRHPAGAPPRLIIDSLTDIVDAHGLEPTLAALRSISGILRRRGGVALIVLEKGVLDSRSETRLHHVAGGLFEFGVERVGHGLYPHLLVSKLPGASNVPLLLLYKETGHGLWFESTRRVF